MHRVCKRDIANARRAHSIRTLKSYALQRLGDERAALFAIVDAGRQQRDIFLYVGRLGLVAGREPRRTCVLRQTRAEGPHLDHEKLVDGGADAQQDGQRAVSVRHLLVVPGVLAAALSCFLRAPKPAAAAECESCSTIPATATPRRACARE